MDEERKHIVLISCHGWVYDKSTKQIEKLGGQQRGNIILNPPSDQRAPQRPPPPPPLPEIQIPIKISTFTQQGCVRARPDEIDAVTDHNLNMSGDLETAFKNYQHTTVPGGFESSWRKESSLRIEGGPPGHPSAAPAEKFCSSLRFPNMWFQDYNSMAKAKKAEQAEKAKQLFLDEVLTPGISIFDTAARPRENQTIFAASVTQIISNKAFTDSLVARGDLSPLNTSQKYHDDPTKTVFVPCINLDHIILHLLPTIYSNPGEYFLQQSTIPTSFEIIIASCIGPNLVDTVLQNVSEGLTWPKMDSYGMTVEISNHIDIASECRRFSPFHARVEAAGQADQKALDFYRKGEGGPFGGRKKIKNTKKKGKKKKSKKKRGKKQTKRNRGKKETKSKKYRKK